MMPSMKALLAVPVILALPAAAQTQALSTFAKTLDAEAKAERLGGIALVAEGGKVRFQHTAGWAVRSQRQPVTPATRFQLASLGKLFTTVAIGQLLEQGKLKLDDSITQFFPDHPEWSAVTIRHLLSHTGGFKSYWGPDFEAKRSHIKAVKDYFPLFEKQPLAFTPGARFEYSNVGFILLGAILEKVSGQDFFVYVHEKVFKPTGMVDTGYFEADEDVPQLALGYVPPEVTGAPGWRTHSQIKPFKGGPAGDAVSSARDLHRFMLALHQGRLLKPETTKLLWTPVTDRPAPPDGPKPGVRSSYGLGFVVNSEGANTWVGHTGGFPGTTTSCFLNPRTGTIAILLLNVNPRPGLLQEFQRAVSAR